MIARIQGMAGWAWAGGGRAVRRLDHKLLDEVANVLTEMRRDLLGGGNRSQRRLPESRLTRLTASRDERQVGDRPRDRGAGEGVHLPMMRGRHQ
jgi:hypothetical protein